MRFLMAFCVTASKSSHCIFKLIFVKSAISFRQHSLLNPRQTCVSTNCSNTEYGAALNTLGASELTKLSKAFQEYETMLPQQEATVGGPADLYLTLLIVFS